MISFKQFSNDSDRGQINGKIIISLSNEHFNKFNSIINEGRITKKVGKIPVDKDSPHFSGGEYHGHVDMPGGLQVSYTVTGKRLHPNKFPMEVPKNVKNAIAQVLGINPDILETYEAYDEIEKTTIILIELKQTKAGKLLSFLEYY